MITNSLQGERTDASPKKRLGFGYFTAAIIFLANPCLNIIDILPDFFGYLFLLKGLSKWADLCPNVRDAKEGLSKLRWFMLLKLLACPLVPIVDGTYVLVLTFGFTVIELIYALPAIFRIFDGLEYFGTRFDSSAIFKGIKDARTLTTVFFVVKSAFCLFPELCELSSFEYSGMITSGVQIDPASFKNPLIILNIAVCIAIGFVWMVTLLKYTSSVSKDCEFLKRVLSDYDLEIGSDIGLALRRTLRSALNLIIAGFIFFPSLYIDGINVIPTFIGAALLTTASVKLSTLSDAKKGTGIAASVLTVTSSLSFVSMIILEVVCTAENTSPEVITDKLLIGIRSFFGISTEEGLYMSTLTATPAVIVFFVSLFMILAEHIAMTVCTLKLFGKLRSVTARHLAPDPDITDRRLTDIYHSDMKEADRSLIAGIVLFIVAITAETVYAFIRTAIAPSFYLIPLIALGIWIIYMINILNVIFSQIEYKYM